MTDGAVLLVHGLAGSARSPLLLRLAQRLYEQGRRVFRLDLRGCGAGLGLARLPYHAGRSEDLAEVVAAIQTWTSTTGTSASLVLFGVSLSGNILLKYMGEQGTALPVNIAGALAVNPPIDLAQCVASLRRPMNRGYDRFFVRALRRQLAVHLQRFPEAPRPVAGFAPRTLYEFDDGYTAPVSGYDNARNYYALCSAAQFLPRICRPTLILTADNDPLVSAQLFTAQPVSDSVAVHVVTGGGHVGYRGCAGRDADPHWLDWRVVEFVTACLHAQ